MQIIYTQAAKLGGSGIGSIAYQFIRAIAQSGSLKKAIVAYSGDHDLPDRQVQSFPWMRVVARLARDNHPVRDSIFDWAASRYIGECDIFHGWSHQCLYSLRRARQQGAITCLERPNSHDNNAQRLVQEEYDRWGFREHTAVRPLGLRRGLAEYAIADHFIVPSVFVHDSFLAEGVDQSRLHLVPYGVDIEHFIPPNATPPRDRFILLFVGQVNLRKGVPYLLQAWDQLNLPKAELWMAGRVSPDAREFVTDYLNHKSIRFLGHTHDTRSLYQQASAFVLPSIEEGSALVTYEAMATALPIIYTYNTGAIARPNMEGLQVPIREVDALAAAIERLYTDAELCRSLGQSGRKRVESYTWRHAGAKLLAAYRTILQRHGRIDSGEIPQPAPPLHQ
ncbi:MAG: glycosyltransferase family 4 protein [Litorilinea sp.]